MPRTGLSPRRRALLEAALRVVADHGLRGLTHRAVDRQARLPEGTCSAYFRTRRALQSALGEFVADSLTRDVQKVSSDLAKHPGDPDRATRLTTRMFTRWLAELDRLQAVLELGIEATRDPELAEQVISLRAQMVHLVDQTLAAAGSPEPAHRGETLVAALHGVLLGGFLQPRRERQAYLERSLGLLFDALVGGDPAPD